jgi:hypothetical protein
MISFMVVHSSYGTKERFDGHLRSSCVNLDTPLPTLAGGRGVGDPWDQGSALVGFKGNFSGGVGRDQTSRTESNRVGPSVMIIL